MRKSLGDALKNAFEETTMKNMPIDQFQNFKWRNGVQNRTICKKLNKIGLFENFYFWSKVNTKVKSPIQLVQGQSQRIHGPGQFWVSRSGHKSFAKMLTSSYDVALTRIKAGMDVLAWLMTSNDIISASLAHGKSVTMSIDARRRTRNIVTHVGTCEQD